MEMVYQLLVQICLEWNYSLNLVCFRFGYGWWITVCFEVWFPPNGLEKKAKIIFPDRPKFASFCCKQYVQNDKIAKFFCVQIKLIPLKRRQMCYVYTLDVKNQSARISAFSSSFYFDYCRVFRVYVFVKNLEIRKRSGGANCTEMYIIHKLALGVETS